MHWSLRTPTRHRRCVADPGSCREHVDREQAPQALGRARKPLLSTTGARTPDRSTRLPSRLPPSVLRTPGKATRPAPGRISSGVGEASAAHRAEALRVSKPGARRRLRGPSAVPLGRCRTTTSPLRSCVLVGARSPCRGTAPKSRWTDQSTATGRPGPSMVAMSNGANAAREACLRGCSCGLRRGIRSLQNSRTQGIVPSSSFAAH